MQLESTLSELRNIGRISELWLNEIGIFNREQLEEIGAADAFVRVRHAGFKPSKNLLWSLAGALSDINANALPREVKDMLEKQVEEIEASDLDVSEGEGGDV